MSLSCTNYVSDELGPLQINYGYIYNCSMHGLESLSILLVICWIIILANLLGSTASNYFSPCLASICFRLNLSYDIAGVTFLAFGNGAPDVFSSITSFSGAADVLIGIGALLGGSVFVTTIVVGSIAIMNPCQIQPKAFYRDIIFHMTAASTLAVIAALGEATILLTVFLFVIYSAYAATVVFGSKSQGSAQSNLTHLTSGSSSQLQTAFWHKAPTSKMKTVKSPIPTNSSQTSQGGYKFLILDEYVEAKHGESVGDDEDTVTINLSGGLISSEFNAEIIDDYFAVDEHGPGSTTLQQKVVEAPTARKHGSSMLAFDGVTMGDDEEPWNPSTFVRSNSANESLTESLLGDDSESGGDTSLDNLMDEGDGQCMKLAGLGNSPPRRPSMTSKNSKNGMYNALYVKQLLLRRRLQRNLMAADWWSYPLSQKLFSILEFPAVFARDMTIPTVDEEMWSKYHAVVQPMTAPLFIVFISGSFMSKVGLLPAPVLSVILGMLPSTIVFFLTHHSYPPKSKFFGTAWVLFAFAMCVSWVYLLAGELVACLSAVGAIFKIPPIYLGLTVLAWGNSIGDFFSNLSIARRGLGEMAVAGCYGGPIFNILMGMGMALCYACVVAYPAPVKIHFDASSLVSLGFLYFSLASTMIIVPLRGYRLEQTFGYYLIALYMCHTATQAALLFSGSK